MALQIDLFNKSVIAMLIFYFESQYIINNHEAIIKLLMISLVAR